MYSFCFHGNTCCAAGQRQGHVSRAVLPTTQQPMIPRPSQTSAPLERSKATHGPFPPLAEGRPAWFTNSSLNTQLNSVLQHLRFPPAAAHAPGPPPTVRHIWQQSSACASVAAALAKALPWNTTLAWHPHGKLDVQLSRSRCRGAVIILAVAAATSPCGATVGIRAMRPCLCVAAATACARVSLWARHAVVPLLALWRVAG